MTNKIKEFLDLYNELEFGGCCVLINNSTDVKWNCDKYSVFWINSEGVFYSGELVEGIQYQDGYAICNLDNNCGQWVTYFFLLENKDENLDEDVMYEEDFDDE